MSATQTSILAFISVQRDLSARQAAVYAVIQRHSAICNLDIADELGIAINSVTGRVLELREKGLVEEAYKAHCRTGRLVSYWRAA
jgi:DNA-binding MarR family transcriptional regulator